MVLNFSSETKGIDTCRKFLNVLTSSPATRGLVGTLLINLTPWSNQISSALWIPSKIVIFLALMTVGIRLGSFSPGYNQTSRSFRLLIQPSLIIKLIIFPALMLGLAKAVGLPTLMVNALVLQAAAPTAISVLLLAEASGQDQQVAASLVAWSTLLSLITVPVWYLALKYLV